MDAMQLGQTAVILGAVALVVSGIFASVMGVHHSRYAETMTELNERLRMKYLGRLFRIGGSTFALGGIVLMLTAVLQWEPRLYQFRTHPVTNGIIATQVTPEEEGSRRLSELTSNIRILSDSQREVSAKLAKPGKSSLARKLAACRRTVRRPQMQRASQPGFTIPTPPPRPAGGMLDEGLSRGDSGGYDDPEEGS